MQSQFELNIFESLEECCKLNWINYGLCMTAGTQQDEPEQSWGEVGTEPDKTDEPDVVMEFYPD